MIILIVNYYNQTQSSISIDSILNNPAISMGFKSGALTFVMTLIIGKSISYACSNKNDFKAKLNENTPLIIFLALITGIGIGYKKYKNQLSILSNSKFNLNNKSSNIKNNNSDYKELLSSNNNMSPQNQFNTTISEHTKKIDAFDTKEESQKHFIYQFIPHF